MANKKIRTMEEFAVSVGLSRPTVSKFFHDPASVRATTRAKIEDALKKTGFRPNIFAVNLNRRRTKIIGLIIPDPMDPFYMALATRIEAEAAEAGYLALVLSSNGQAEVEARAIETVTALNAAGAIVAPLALGSPPAKLRTLGKTMPLVYVDAPPDDDGPFVGTDNNQSVSLMTEYLCRSGDLPTFFDTPVTNNNAVDRRRTYIAAMERLNHEPRFADLPPSTSMNFEEVSFRQASRILREGGFATRTIFCSNDRVAFGVLGAMYQAGLKVGFAPDCDYRVAGHDNQRMSAYSCPPLTTVAQDCDAMGRIALQLLFAHIGDGLASGGTWHTGDRVLLNAELVLRQSA